jgi:hypothetical protein
MTSVRTPQGYALRKTSDRLRAKRKAQPVAVAAETMLRHGMGIIKDGEVVTEMAIQEFARRFEGQVEDDVIASPRDLFKVGTAEDEAVDVALIGHGGSAGLDLEAGSADPANV